METVIKALALTAIGCIAITVACLMLGWLGLAKITGVAGGVAFVAQLILIVWDS